MIPPQSLKLYCPFYHLSTVIYLLLCPAASVNYTLEFDWVTSRSCCHLFFRFHGQMWKQSWVVQGQNKAVTIAILPKMSFKMLVVLCALTTRERLSDWESLFEIISAVGWECWVRSECSFKKEEDFRALNMLPSLSEAWLSGWKQTQSSADSRPPSILLNAPLEGVPAWGPRWIYAKATR